MSKLGGGVDHVTGHVSPLCQVERSQGHIMYQQQECYILVVDAHIDVKFGGNYYCGSKTCCAFSRSVVNSPIC